MTRKAIQTVTNPTSRSGIAHPASMPSNQLRNGLRHRAGEISERAAMAANVKSMGTKTHSMRQMEKTRSLMARRLGAACCPGSRTPGEFLLVQLGGNREHHP